MIKGPMANVLKYAVYKTHVLKVIPSRRINNLSTQGSPLVVVPGYQLLTEHQPLKGPNHLSCLSSMKKNSEQTDIHGLSAQWVLTEKFQPIHRKGKEN